VVKYILMMLILFVSSQNALAEVYLRDPTTPVKGGVVVSDFTSEDNGSLKLQAVFVGNGKSRAIIDGKTCSLGEECGGYILTTITSKGVILTSLDHKEKLTLPLYSFGNEK
jgi:hypothetical protein